MGRVAVTRLHDIVAETHLESSVFSGLSFADLEPVGGEGGQPAPNAVTSQVTRLESGVDQSLCSTGFPCKPGAILDSELDEITVFVGGIEQAVYVEALDGRHLDGTVRSVLIQFLVSIDYGSPLSAVVTIGGGVSRGPSDISKTPIVWGLPAVVCLPTQPDYLIACDILVAPTIPVADVPASPTYLQDFEDDFDNWAEQHWALTAGTIPGDNGEPWSSVYQQYDRSHVWFTWWIRTGTFKYFYRFAKSAQEWVDVTAARASNNMWAPRFLGPESMAQYYWMTGWDSAKTELIRSTNYCRIYYADTGKMDVPDGDSRIGAKCLQGYIVCHMVGDVSRDWEAEALDAVDRILATQSGSGAYDQFDVWENAYGAPQHSVYQSGMVHFSFWQYYNYIDADSRIPPAIKKTLDYEIANGWVSGDKAFKYLIPYSTGGAVDLNGLILFGYVWYYLFSSTSTYLTYANDMLDGLNGAYWYGAKQFNEICRQTTPYYLWRDG